MARLRREWMGVLSGKFVEGDPGKFIQQIKMSVRVYIGNGEISIKPSIVKYR